MSGVIRRLYRAAVQAHCEGVRTHEAVVRLLHRIGRADSLLDVGCREGAKARLYADLLAVPAARLFGIEQNPRYIELAEKAVTVLRVDLERDRFPLPDEELDVVVCNQVLEHLKNIYLPLREMARVVRTGGYLVIGIPNLAALQNRVLMLLGRQPMCNAILGPHVRGFTAGAFRDFLRTNPNVELVAITGATLYPLPYPLVRYGALAAPSLSSFVFYLLKKVRHSPHAGGWDSSEQRDDTVL